MSSPPGKHKSCIANGLEGVVEDAVAGLQAARAAGCRGLVAVTTTTGRADLEPLAHLVVADLASLAVTAHDGLVHVDPGP